MSNYPYEGRDAERHPDLFDAVGAVGIWAVLAGVGAAVLKFLL